MASNHRPASDSAPRTSRLLSCVPTPVCEPCTSEAGQQVCDACQDVETWYTLILGAAQASLASLPGTYVDLYLSRLLNDGLAVRDGTCFRRYMDRVPW